MNLELTQWGATPPDWFSASLLASLADIIREVCNLSQVEPRTMFLNRRGPQRIARTRQIAMSLCREKLNLTFEDIGQTFGNRHHATVIHAVKMVHQRTKSRDRQKTA